MTEALESADHPSVVQIRTFDRIAKNGWKTQRLGHIAEIFPGSSFSALALAMNSSCLCANNRTASSGIDRRRASQSSQEGPRPWPRMYAARSTCQAFMTYVLVDVRMILLLPQIAFSG
jgi:hypothetical protein